MVGFLEMVLMGNKKPNENENDTKKNENLPENTWFGCKTPVKFLFGED